jgi:hypothetical protein
MNTLAILEAMPVRAYAGIGSRETPANVLVLMTRLAAYLGGLNFRLRTGGAQGADTAFEQGAPEGMTDLFLPWPGFNGHARARLLRPTGKAHWIARRYHPTWDQLSPGVRALHARNVHQVLGTRCVLRSALIVCWTPDGATEETTSHTGGTGQAIRLAVAHSVPVYNLARPDHRATWEKLL